MSEARETRRKVDWFRGEWAARKLPALNPLELRTVLWCRARRCSRDELALAIARCERLARRGDLRAFVRVFGKHGDLSAAIHDERRRRDGLEDAPERARGAPERAWTPQATPPPDTPPAASMVSASGRTWTAEAIEARLRELRAGLRDDGGSS